MTDHGVEPIAWLPWGHALPDRLGDPSVVRSAVASGVRQERRPRVIGPRTRARCPGFLLVLRYYPKPGKLRFYAILGTTSQGFANRAEVRKAYESSSFRAFSAICRSWWRSKRAIARGPRRQWTKTLSGHWACSSTKSQTA